MKATRRLHDLGQSLWLDSITRGMLQDGTLLRYIDEMSVTGLTSNPSTFDRALQNSDAYDAAIRRKASDGKSGETLYFELAIEDRVRAADVFGAVHNRTSGEEGWVSLEVSPLVTDDTAATIRAAAELHARARRPNLFIEIPGTPTCLPAIEALILAGVPVNVTLLFSATQYLAAAEAYMSGIERRIAAGLHPQVASVASLFVSHWDVAVRDTAPPALRDRLGIAIAWHAYREYRRLIASPRWRALAAAGARPQRLLWASTGSKNAYASDTLYVEALAAPDTIDAMPEKTLTALHDHGRVEGALAEDGGEAEAVLVEFASAGVDVTELAVRLQREGIAAFTASWKHLLQRLAEKRTATRPDRARAEGSWATPAR